MALFIAVCVATCVAIRLKRAKERMKLKEDLILELRNGNGVIKNAAFVIYNDSEPDDDIFVKDILCPGLEIRLKQKIKSERDLVRFKARDIKPGAVLLDKTDELIKNSSVIVVLLTEHSFEDNSVEMVLLSCFPTGEANQVPKPIVYVIKGETDTNELPRGISLHFRSAKKIMWRKNTEYNAQDLDYLCDLIMNVPIEACLLNNITVLNIWCNIFKGTGSKNTYRRLENDSIEG
ncbi:hypothetical protein DPMN_173050 [Dreissena polymorpha]|uniref:Uncharacterized protein n=1 Tax=Dreissena polymorpha TaxID=45954 RepID=A0A9D4E4R0_DREPO|nr:hypothetical protein DPMN_173050 [Dreissena polymorpha]